MAYLPAEILHMIIEKIPWHCRNLPPLATINRQWQEVVEDRLWRHMYLFAKDIDAFTKSFHTGARKRALQHIHFQAEYFKEPAKDERREGRGSTDLYSDGYGGSSDNEESDNEDSSSSDSYHEERNHDITGNGVDDQDYYYKLSDTELENREDDDKDKVHGMNHQSPQQTSSAFQQEHLRFFRDVKKIWDEVASWGPCMKVKSIEIVVDGPRYGMYRYLGRDFRDAKVVQTYLSAENWLSSPGTQLPLLPSVETFIMAPEGNSHLDLWPAIAACIIAKTLPTLKLLEISGDEYEPRWEHARRECREVLAKQLMDLPPSVETVLLALANTNIANQWIEPLSFLTGGVDSLSRAINCFSNNLTKLFLDVNPISPELFWNLSPSTSETVCWPNLRVLDVRTAFETTAGQYWMRGADNFPEVTNYLGDYFDHQEGYQGSEPYSDAEDELLDEQLGAWPRLCYRIRPVPELFDALAISIARAVSRMPKLDYLNLEFNADHRGPNPSMYYEHFEDYQGWAFYFRSGNHAKSLASTYFKDQWQDPGPDRTDVERPRSEWVFSCPYRQVQWKQPEDADALWRERFPGMDFDLVTFDDMDNRVLPTWSRHRNGRLICESVHDTSRFSS